MEVVPDDGCDRGFVIKKADPSIKDKIAQEKYIDAFTLFVLGFYKETKPKYTIMTEMNMENTEIGDDYVDPKDGLAVCVGKLFNITKSPMDKLKCSEVHKMITNEFRDATPQKIKVFLGNRGVEIKKNVVNHYVGIALKEERTILDVVHASHRITVHALQFLKLYLLSCFENGVKLPLVTEHLVVSIMNVLCEESEHQETRGRRCNPATLTLKQKLLEFHREHYKLTMTNPREKLGFTNKAQLLHRRGCGQGL
ncbi:hypothetical protein BASA81_006375 [Batrachochytrium salamandrivorans]|nr:hypothetical protein BASA81_006375 [Batrachochytrium salamandrivorans]